MTTWDVSYLSIDLFTLTQNILIDQASRTQSLVFGIHLNQSVVVSRILAEKNLHGYAYANRLSSNTVKYEYLKIIFWVSSRQILITAYLMGQNYR